MDWVWVTGIDGVGWVLCVVVRSLSTNFTAISAPVAFCAASLKWLVHCLVRYVCWMELFTRIWSRPASSQSGSSSSNHCRQISL